MIFVTVKGRPIGFKRTTHRQKFVDKSYHKYRDYKYYIQECLSDANITSYGDSKVKVGVIVMLHGKGAYNMGRDGDIDNYVKAALDACNGIAFDDDRQVMAVSGEKLEAKDKDSEGMVIMIERYKCIEE